MINGDIVQTGIDVIKNIGKVILKIILYPLIKISHLHPAIKTSILIILIILAILLIKYVWQNKQEIHTIHP